MVLMTMVSTCYLLLLLPSLLFLALCRLSLMLTSIACLFAQIIGRSRVVEGLHKDGTVFPIRLSVSVCSSHTNCNGDLATLAIVSQTPRRAATITATHSLGTPCYQEVNKGTNQALYIGMIEKLDDKAGVITANYDGKILSCNNNCEALWGYSVNELVGRNLSILMPEPYASLHDTYLRNYLRTGKTNVIGKVSKKIDTLTHTLTYTYIRARTLSLSLSLECILVFCVLLLLAATTLLETEACWSILMRCNVGTESSWTTQKWLGVSSVPADQPHEDGCCRILSCSRRTGRGRDDRRLYSERLGHHSVVQS
jgi:PAS domain-containing protein